MSLLKFNDSTKPTFIGFVLFVLEQYHLGVVVDYDNKTEKDPKARAVGIVTLEDIIEEMIQEEIIDETDVFSKFRFGSFEDPLRRKKTI